jgi:hypothetical protein
VPRLDWSTLAQLLSTPPVIARVGLIQAISIAWTGQRIDFAQISDEAIRRVVA